MARFTIDAPTDTASAGGRFSIMPDDELSARVRAEGGTPDTFGGRIAAGMGKAVYDVGRGAGQMGRQALEAVGARRIADLINLPTQADIDEARRLDQPLSDTGGGKLGEVLGNVAMFAPTAMIPGANTVTGAGVIGGVMGALRPTVEGESRLKNTAIGAATGAGTQYVLGKVVGALGNAKASAETSAATEAAQNAERDAALKAGREAGYVASPSMVNQNLTNEALESVSGKTYTAQSVSYQNQGVTDTLARRALGLTQNAPLNEGKLVDMRKIAGQAYQAIKNVGGKMAADDQFAADTSKIGADFSQAAAEFPESTRNTAIEALNKDLSLGSWSPTAIVEKVKLLRSDASANFRAFDDPAKLALARAQRQAADALDGLVERNLTAGGQGDLADAYQAARTLIAKTHDVEAALTPGGHVNAQIISKIGQGKNLSGDLQTIADFAGNFPKAVQPVEKIGGMARALRPSIGSAVGAVIGGGPVGAAAGAGAGVAIPWTMKQLLLSRAGQSLLASPSYGPGTVGTVSDLLANPIIRASLPPAGTVAALHYRAQQ